MSIYGCGSPRAGCVQNLWLTDHCVVGIPLRWGWDLGLTALHSPQVRYANLRSVGFSAWSEQPGAGIRIYPTDRPPPFSADLAENKGGVDRLRGRPKILTIVRFSNFVKKIAPVARRRREIFGFSDHSPLVSTL